MAATPTPPTASSETTRQRIAAIRRQMSLLSDYLDPKSLEAQVGELEQEMGAPGFWDNQEKAAETSAEHARASRKLEAFRSLTSDAEDLEPLAEMAQEDSDLEGELNDQITSVERRLAQLEE